MKSIFQNIILSFLLSINMSNAQKPSVSRGSIAYFKFNHSKYIDEREIAVWLPANYSITKKYSVLYMQDAKSLFDSSLTWNHEAWKADNSLQELIDNAKIKNTILVGIYNAEKKRRSEYFPQKVFYSFNKEIQDSLKNLKDSNNNFIFEGIVQSDNYLKFIVEELKPYIDSCFSTNISQSSTFIAGSSMGALISLYALCEYPHIFGGAACLSTHWTGAANFIIKEIPESILSYFSSNLPVAGKHKIYFDYGSIGLDSLYKPYQNKMDDMMRLKNYQADDWVTKEFIGDGHTEKAWRNRINVPLEFLLRL